MATKFQQKNTSTTQPRPAMSPFDVALTPEAQAELAKNIEAINRELEKGNRGYFNVPTGHANPIKEAFEGSAALATWHVTITNVNPTFATLVFRANDEPEAPAGQPALALLAQIRAELQELLKSLPVPTAQGLPGHRMPEPTSSR